MGNTVISGILFQPPSPHMPLNYHGPSQSQDIHTSNSSDSKTSASAAALAKHKQHNISVKYLWLYSSDDYGVERLIPAVHIKHNNDNLSASEGAGRSNTHRYTLLYSHGNAEDIGLIASFLTDLARLLQINVLCYDYSGYGVSTSEEYVAEFFTGFGKELETWKNWRIAQSGREKLGVMNKPTNKWAVMNRPTSKWAEVSTKNGKYVCRYSSEVFVAPIVHPTQTANASNGGEWDPFVSASEEEDDNDTAYSFTNTCGDWNNDTPGHNDTSTSRSTIFASLNDPTRPTSTTSNQNAKNTRSPAKQRRSTLSRHSWSYPSPSEMNCYANIQSAYNYLTTVECMAPQHVILYGKSVGSGPTCWLAQRLCRDDYGTSVDNNDADDNTSCTTDEMCLVESREPVQKKERAEVVANNKGGEKNVNAPGGVVLHSPFMSVIRVVLDVGFTTIGDLFPNVDRVGDFTCPVYVIHGSNDAIVPFYHGQTLFQTLPDSSKTVPFWARGAGHNNIEMDMPTAYIKRLQQFVRQCDRLNYPSQLSPRKVAQQQLQKKQQQQQQMLLQASLETSLRQSMHHQGQGVVGHHHNQQQQQQGGGRPGITRYASQDSYHNMMMQQKQPQGALNKTLSTQNSKPSKQRKQKGTLVMRSSHNQALLQPPLPVAPSPLIGQGRRSGTSSRNWIGEPCNQQQHPTMSIQHQHQQQQVMQQQQQQVYAPNNTNVRYSQQRSMSSSMLNNNMPVLSPHHSPYNHSQKHLHQQQQHVHQQQQQQQQYHSQNHHNAYDVRSAGRVAPGDWR